ncbi:MAG TPA: flagellar protein FlaG [Gammaproteobacteria bacterium]|nr:flagellar protein FlaG [Gammaproteobacteria bacterium]
MNPITAAAQNVAKTPVSVRSTPREQAVTKLVTDELEQKKSAPETKPLAREELDGVVKEINQTVQNVVRDIRFQLDKETDKVVIKVIDQSTQEEIRQLPPEEVLNMMENLSNLKGILFKEEA